MSCSNRRYRFVAPLLVLGLAAGSLEAAPSSRAHFGRLAGAVTDTQGNPLMGATVMIMGPVGGMYAAAATRDHVITDSRGEFTVERLLPGWYSLRVISATRLPTVRNGVLVVAGQTAQQKFALSDILAPLRAPTPSARVAVSSSGEDWKWILRSAAATRPVLRYQETARATTSTAKTKKPSLPAARRLIGVTPGSTRSDALAGDPGMGSVLAYLRPLSEDSDVLVAGSMAAYGPEGSSLATSFRNHLMKGDPQELTLVVHQLSFTEGSPFAVTGAFGSAQGVVVGYSHTRHVSDALSLTAGFEVDHLNALRVASVASPHMKLEYRVNPSTLVVWRYGTVRLDDDSGSLLERVGTLNAFPRVTLRNSRLRLEQLNHGELALHRRLGKSSRLEVAGYQDYFQNAAVWTVGAPGTSAWLAGNLLPNPNSGGLVLNTGDYHSSGLRAAYSVSLGNRLTGALDYAVGEALTLNATRLASGDTQRGFQGVFRPAPSRSFGGKVSTRVSISNTQVTTSYQWIERGRVTGVDPYGQAELQVQPFLGVQIRQPLPSLAFFPCRIEALADFRNLLGQGYVSLPRQDGKPLLLSSAYRSLRGGFSVQF